MPATSAPSRSTVVSADGTRLTGWTNGGDGPTVLLCNGLGTVPSAWPALVAPDSGYRVLTWYQRGTFTSARPADRSRVRVQDHVDDAVAVLDAAGVEQALVASWSIGVNVAFELARRHPDRVTGLLAVAGVPGGTFSTMGEPLRMPRALRHPIATTVARAGRLAGPALTLLTAHVPVDARLAWLLRHSGFLTPAARTEVLVPMLEEFLRQDWRWYMTLAVAAAEHRAMDLSFLQQPVIFLAGRSDVLTSVSDVVRVAGTVPHAEVEVLPGSHFLTLEHPDLVHAALGRLRDRVAAAAGA